MALSVESFVKEIESMSVLELNNLGLLLGGRGGGGGTAAGDGDGSGGDAEALLKSLDQAGQLENGHGFDFLDQLIGGESHGLLLSELRFWVGG